jgi:hypothetical protein
MTSDQCRLGDEIGYCEDTGYCTFSDTGCDSQRRYDETAEFPLAGECLTGFVTGHVTEQFIVNDDAGAPTVVTRAPAMLDIKAELDDGTAPAVRLDHDGTFSFPAPAGSHYTVMVPVFGDLQSSASHLEIASFSSSRPDPARVTKATSIKFTYNATALGSLWLGSTGIYTETLTTGTATNFSFDWFTAKSEGAKPGLLSSDSHDRLYVNQTANIGGYESIVASATEQLTLADGVMTNAMGQLAPTTRDQCVQLKTSVTADEARLKSAESTLTTPTSEWWIGAAQRRDDTTGGSFTLAQHKDMVAANAMLNVTFANPFPGTKPLAYSYADAKYTAAAAGFTVPLADYAQTFVSFDTLAGSCAATATLANTTAIGGALVVGGTTVDANDKEITTDLTKRIPLAWSQTVSGVANWWWIGLFEVSDDGAGGLVFANVYWLATPDTHALWPKGLLASGHTYLVMFLAQQGTPNAGQGDFVTMEYPVGETASWSKSFKIK